MLINFFDVYRLKVIGAYGLKNKREVWRVQFTLAKIRYVLPTPSALNNA